MGIVHDAFLWHLQTEQEDNDRAWQEAHSHHLAVSDLGHCVRKAYLRLRKSQETHPHDDYVLGIMRDGNVYQNDTARALAAWYGGQVHWEKDDPALLVRDDKWLGHLDFLVCTSTGDVIVEHKATNPDNFCKRNRLPYPFHCYQLAGYGILRQKMGHPPARLLLYYRSWGHWAEVELFSNEFGISWEGEFDGDYRGGMIDVAISWRPTGDSAVHARWTAR